MTANKITVHIDVRKNVSDQFSQEPKASSIKIAPPTKNELFDDDGLLALINECEDKYGTANFDSDSDEEMVEVG